MNLSRDGIETEIEKYNYAPSPHAWNTEFPKDDAHCLCYELQGQDFFYKLNLDGLEELAEHGYVPMLRWVHFELDNPKHAAWPGLKRKGDYLVDANPEVFQERLQQILQLPIPELQRCGIYQTRGGLHIVWPLETPVPIDQANVFLRSFYQHLRKAGLGNCGMVFDKTCAEWTRAMRMPGARRKIQDGSESFWATLNLYRDFSRMAPLQWSVPADYVEISARPASFGIEAVDESDPLFDAMREIAWDLLSYQCQTIQNMEPKTGRNNRLTGAAGDIRQVFEAGLIDETEYDNWVEHLTLSAVNAKEYAIHDHSVAIAQGLNRLNSSATISRIREQAQSKHDDMVLFRLLEESDRKDAFHEIFVRLVRSIPSTTTSSSSGTEVEKDTFKIDTIDASEFDGTAFSTANRIKEAIRQRIWAEDPEADVTWLRNLEVIPDRIDKKNPGALTAKGGFRPSRTNMILILLNDPYIKGHIYWNELECDISIQKPIIWPHHVKNSTPEAQQLRWTEQDYIRLKEWFKFREYGLEIAHGKEIEEAVIAAAMVHSRHPIREYLHAAHAKWKEDGKRRLDGMLANYFSVAPSKLASAAGKCWMISAVARVMRPGCKVDTCLIFDGKEGKHKSTSMKALSPNQAWVYNSVLPIGDKEAYQNLQGIWICELPELSSLNKHQLALLKAFLASNEDRFRESYGRKAKSHPRQHVEFATTNERHYLTDGHEHRRMWTVTVTDRIDNAAIERDRDLLWGEAVEEFLSGTQWWFTDELTEQLQAAHEIRTISDPWKSFIIEAIRSPRHQDIVKRGYVTTDEVLIEVLGFDRKELRGIESERVVNIMEAIGWTESRKVIDGDSRKKWLDPQGPHAQMF